MKKNKYPYGHRRDPFVVWEKKMAEARADATLKANVRRMADVGKAVEECGQRITEIFQHKPAA